MPKLLDRLNKRPCWTRRTLLALRWFLFLACFEFRIPTTPSNPACLAGWPKKQAVTWIGSGLLLCRVKPDRYFWKQSFSDSPINGVDPCSKIEDVTNYQNALSKALLVSIPPLFPHLFPLFQARWLKLSEMTGCMPLCSVRFLLMFICIQFISTTGHSLLLRKPPRKQTGLETGRQLFISMSRQAASFTRLSSMHVNQNAFV